jgi:hypothetical protein
MSLKFRKANKLSRRAAIVDCRSTTVDEASHVLSNTLSVLMNQLFRFHA